MSLNKVILIGNVGKDPEVKYFDSGSATAKFPLATSERGYKLANGTEVPERTEWHNIVVRREQVAFVEKWVKKGSGVYVEGKIRTRNYDDQSGVKRYITEIYADRIEFFGSGRRDKEEGQSEADNRAAASSAPSAPPAANAADTAPSSSPIVPEAGEPDDLPF